jgi:hypothetical protein
MPTVVQILADIDRRLPNDFTEASKLAWCNDVQRKLLPYIEQESVYEFVASSSVEYSLSTNIRIDRIKHVYTGDSTALADISSTTIWSEHQYSGADDTLTGYRYYVPNITHFNTTSVNSIGLFPVSTEVRVARIYFNTLLPALTTLNSPVFNEEWHDILKFGVMEIIAKAGNNPDVDLANNYHMEYREILKEIKRANATKKWKRPRMKWSYEQHTWG